jgi:hypothetical protein
LQPIDEGAEVALKTVDRKADSMKKIFFVLKDDDIYDAWVKKAEQLQFMSLDGTGAAATSTSKQSTTSTNTRKVPQNPDAHSESNASNEKSERKVIDGSSGERTQNPAAHDHEEPSEKSSTNPNEKSDDQELAETDKGDEAKKTKRYVISTAELMVFIIFFLKDFYERKMQKNFKYFDIYVLFVHSICEINNIRNTISFCRTL